MSGPTISLLSAALAATLLLPCPPAQAGKTPPAGPTYTLHWRASTSVYWDAINMPQHEVIKWSSPRGMNDDGDVVGLACWDARDVDPDNSGENWEVFLSLVQPDGTRLTQNLNDVVQNELPAGWRLTDAADINNAGEVVGGAEYRMTIDGVVVQKWGLFRYVPFPLAGSPVLEILESTPQDPWTLATSINDAGDMLVHLEMGGGLHPHLYLLNGDLIELAEPAGGIGLWRANAINRWRDVCGNARVGDYVQAVRYTSANETTASLGWLKNPGPSRWAHGEEINDSGQVVGTSTTGTTVHAFRCTNGEMKDLGALGKSKTYGYGINNAGDCVGDAPGSGRAFVYMDSKGMVDLKAALAGSLLPLPPDFAQLRLEALRINNKERPDGRSAGWILGRLGNQACLFTPNQ